MFIDTLTREGSVIVGEVVDGEVAAKIVAMLTETISARALLTISHSPRRTGGQSWCQQEHLATAFVGRLFSSLPLENIHITR